MSIWSALAKLAVKGGSALGGAIVEGLVKLVERETRDGRSLDFGAGEQGPPMPLSHADVEHQRRQAAAAAQAWPCVACGGATSHVTTCPRVVPPRKPRK